VPVHVLAVPEKVTSKIKRLEVVHVYEVNTETLSVEKLEELPETPPG